jgi:hypothetical protein
VAVEPLVLQSSHSQPPNFSLSESHNTAILVISFARATCSFYEIMLPLGKTHATGA